MKTRHPKRVITLTAHEAQRLRVLLLRILEGRVGQDEMTKPMLIKVYDKLAASIGVASYSKLLEFRNGLG